MTRPAAADRLKALAFESGFDSAGVARADAIPFARERLRAFLAAGRHGDMEWMAARAEERSSPAALWPEVRSVLMVGMNYGPDEDPLATLGNKTAGAISVYARGRDYHDVVKKRLRSLARAIAQEFDCALKVFVDTAPVMEKPLAAAAGLGWQGKHTNLVSRDLGSWLFLGAVFLPFEVAADPPHDDHCGACRRCLDACPTGAFPSPYTLDARRCISYLTIEHKGPIPHEFRAAMGNRIYGCDDCLAVCPWNKFAVAAREATLKADPDRVDPPLADLAALDDADFRRRFAGSPLKRTGRDRLVRNVLIAIGNSNDPDLAECAERLIDDASPLVRGAAVWALSRLAARDEFARLERKNAGIEADPGVREEWRLGLSR